MPEDELIYFCCEEKEIDIFDYFLLLSECPYEEHTKENRRLIRKRYRHVQGCETCHNAYEYLKEVFERVKELPEEDAFFSLEEFERIKRNERYLEKLLISKK